MNDSSTAKTLMLQGTSSSVGKSLLTAALCRIFSRRGIRVAPFKAQNMSNNADVCADGSEIGRSQALQAVAAGAVSTADMNPVLLKPEADDRSQVVVNGRVWKNLGARNYFEARDELWPVVTTALDRLRSEYDLVLIEGAGSPAELNLRQVELVNMAIARYAKSPVILIGDIERGGVFAQLLGTLWLLNDEDRRLVRGLLVNKFRGDPSLFENGVSLLQQRGGKPVLGVVPWIPGLNLPEEDAVALNDSLNRPASTRLDIAVIHLPHIANFDDFDPLACEPSVSLRYVDSPKSLGQPDAVILPGSKSTMADLAWLRQVKLAERIERLGRSGTPIVGICGGFQMLGRSIRDPDRIESNTAEMKGLRLLPVETVFTPAKETNQVRAKVRSDDHCPGCKGDTVSGYEIHMARTQGHTPWLDIFQRNKQAVSVGDGAVSADGRIWGCYLHGLFANDHFRRAWLGSLKVRPEPERRPGRRQDVDAQSIPPAIPSSGSLNESLNRLADGVEAAIDMKRLEQIVWG